MNINVSNIQVDMSKKNEGAIATKKLLSIHNLIVNRKFSFSVFVIIPLIFIIIYQVFIASDRYESKAELIIRSEDTPTSNIDLSMLGVLGSNNANDSLVTRQYVLSKDMLKELQSKLQIKQHYNSKNIDYFSRLSKNASFEDVHEYFLDYINVEYDLDSKILTFSVQAFDNKSAHELLSAIVTISEKFIDKLNDKLSFSRLRFLISEHEKNSKELELAKTELLLFQNKHRIISPDMEGKVISTTIGALSTELAKKASEYKGKQKYLTSTSPQLISLQTEIEALEQQIANEKSRLAGKNGESLSKLDAIYQQLLLKLEFSTAAFKSTWAAIEQTRIETARQLKFMVIVSEPTLAEEAQYPKRLYIILTSFLVCLMIYAIFSLVIAIIMEHR